MAALGDPIRGFGTMLEEWANAIEESVNEALVEVARVAVEDHLRPGWSVATGKSRDAWESHAIEGGAEFSCQTDYSSYTFEKGDRLRTPIYLDRVPQAIQAASNEVGIGAILADITEAYVGQGRTTSHLTGVHRKMLRHTPSDQAKAWRENYPELIERVIIEGYGEQELVPSDTIAAGGGGTHEIEPW